MAFNPY